MHFLCSPFGSSGDIHPLLGLALVLKQRGHRVTFIVNGHFEEVVKKYGVDFIELGGKEAFLQSASHPDLWKPMRGFRHIWSSLIQPGLREQYAIFADLYRPDDTVGIVNCFGVGDWVKPSQFTPQHVTQKLGNLLSLDAVKSQCAQFQHKLRMREGHSRAAMQIEEFAASHLG